MPSNNVQLAMGHVSLGLKIDSFFAAQGMGMNPYGLRRARLRQIIQLESQSDGDLARLGLTRDGILPHVFRDILHS
ncbi:hypothetical protein [Pelagimonas varians]|uniref:DUF1127 domain-containing protein n=1 Tax=Pelagimonas varians TaxID=696760 RepID=A0A238KXB5_9RHOB|nr:hypothetical protein [Pelagimonas varians]PYG27745.1 hypothetical protein C8N36_11420 [Pelagimonas varians]SMX47357.1 hypothetical protein PEV8663_03519 [Pelagimonas varians]